MVRYNIDGSLDQTFGTNGRVATDFFGGDDRPQSVALQPDGKIVAAGYAYNGLFDFAVVRYNADGSLDTTFDGDGKVMAGISSGTGFSVSTAIRWKDRARRLRWIASEF